MVKELGDEAIDEFIVYFSQVLQKLSEQQTMKSMMTAYRFRGSEFVLLVKEIDYEQAEQIAKQLRSAISRVGEKYKKKDIAHTGIIPFNLLETEEALLLAANEAYEQARMIGANGYHIRMLKDQARDITEWKKLVFSVIDNHNYNVTFVGKTTSFKSEKLLMEEAYTQIFDAKGDLVSTATFVSIAEKYAKIIELDKGVVLKVMGYVNTTKISHAVAINLSTRTIKNSAFLVWLADVIKQNQVISQQLVFSLSAYAVAKDITAYIDFINFVHQLKVKVMIKRFEIRSLSPEKIKILHPDFIRLARDIGTGVVTNSRKKTYVETMQELGEVLDIKILAEDVFLENDYNYLKTIGIEGASR
jgi:EAL domain-containing protein (putative c-di-GMP-specific phosphodiesterase class I)